MSAKHTDVRREVVTARLKPALIKQLRQLGEAERRSLSELIEMAVEDYIERNGSRKAKGNK